MFSKSGYGAYTVSPEYDSLLTVITCLLLDSITLDCLPNLSDKTTPT